SIATSMLPVDKQTFRLQARISSPAPSRRHPVRIQITCGAGSRGRGDAGGGLKQAVDKVGEGGRVVRFRNKEVAAGPVRILAVGRKYVARHREDRRIPQIRVRS